MFAAVPSEFANDSEGKKAVWRNALRERLEGMTKRQLAQNELRHSAYRGASGAFDERGEPARRMSVKSTAFDPTPAPTASPMRREDACRTCSRARIREARCRCCREWGGEHFLLSGKDPFSLNPDNEPFHPIEKVMFSGKYAITKKPKINKLSMATSHLGDSNNLSY